MNKKVIVAGHICIDITPEIKGKPAGSIQDLFSPGSLINVGAADIHTGGLVANTGLAMKFLGADVSLLGKVGNDFFGDMVESILRSHDAAEGLIRKEGESTSYSVVLAIPGVDRIFLHDSGANDTFTADDIPADRLKEAALFHFGYPTSMKKMYENDGKEFVRVMKSAADSGAATSLDLTALEPDSEPGRVDWKLLLSKVLPFTDIFVPSVGEICFMLDRDMYESISRRAGTRDFTEVLSLEENIIPLAEKCISMGAKIVLIKCGVSGLYYRVTNEDRLGRISPRIGIDAKKWAGKSGFVNSFKPDKILSGTGAGDTCAAAFLVSILNGYPPEKCAQYAAATGACAVTTYDALSGLKTFLQLDEKFENGWQQNNILLGR